MRGHCYPILEAAALCRLCLCLLARTSMVSDWLTSILIKRAEKLGNRIARRNVVYAARCKVPFLRLCSDCHGSICKAPRVVRRTAKPCLVILEHAVSGHIDSAVPSTRTSCLSCTRVDVKARKSSLTNSKWTSKSHEQRHLREPRPASLAHWFR